MSRIVVERITDAVRPTRGGAEMLRYMTVVGALCAACAPFLSGGVPRPEADATVIGLAVGVVLTAVLAVSGGRATRVFAAVSATGVAAAVWWLLVSDLVIGLTGDDLPVMAVGSLAAAVGAIGLAGRRSPDDREPVTDDPPRRATQPAEETSVSADGLADHRPGPPAAGGTELSARFESTSGSHTGSDAGAGVRSEPHAESHTGSDAGAGVTSESHAESHTGSDTGSGAGAGMAAEAGVAGDDQAEGRARSGRWRVGVGGVLAVVGVVVAAGFASVGAEAVIVRSETREAREFAPEPVAERPGWWQWAWQPPADVVEVAPVLHGVAVATRDGAVVALNGTDGRVEWRYARPGAPVGAVVASMDRRTLMATFRSLHDTRAQSVVVLDADTGTPRFEMVVRSVLVETGQLMPGTRTLTLRDREVISGYDVMSGERRWQWTPPADCTSWFGQVAWGRTTVLVPVVCANTLGVTALDEETGRERWRHEVRRDEADGERQDVRLHGTPDGSTVLLQVFGAQATPDAVPNGLLDAETGRVLTRPERPWTVRTDAGATPLVEEQEGSQVTGLFALDPATGATTRLPIDDCPRRTADLTTPTTYVRACADNGRELTVVTQPLDGSPPTSTPVRLDGSGSRGPRDVRLVAVPGALVITRTTYGGTPAPVVGLS